MAAPDPGAGGTGAALVLVLWGLVEALKVAARKWRPKSSVALDDRRLLSADEGAFRQEILTEVRYLRSELAACQGAHASATQQLMAMGDKLAATNRRLDLANDKLDKVTAAAQAAGVALGEGPS